MMKNVYKTLFLGLLGTFLLACDDDDNNSKPSLRTKVDYAVLSPTTVYAETFKDASGESTVDFTAGNTRLKMFQALNYYISSSVSANTEIEATHLKNLFSNAGDPFVDIQTATISIAGSDLNNSDIQLKEAVASSKSSAEAEGVRAKIESYFDDIDAVSQHLGQTAAEGTAGKLGTYLVDERGIEPAQVIQKSLIGALQLDYISNVLLDEGLNADNHSVVEGKNHTQLEHNWDEAYGLLTLNPIYLDGATNENKNTIEFAAGSYIWEYNEASYAKIYPAFLKGRAAAVNNDKAEMLSQANFIRTEFEKALAGAALGYLDKWKDLGTDDAKRAHATSEGLGFIYALRFATIHNSDAAFSDAILEGLVGGDNNTFWTLTPDKILQAEEAIKTKFNL